ncbi:MAG: hypothetical protein EBQ66_01910 [Flavobacteriia bacterium]|nr:hypothetical protein [Flavobacteriia bacterium]
MSTPPVSFQTLAQTAGNPAAGGYPYQLKASDLDKNFVFATLDVDDSLIESITGAGGHPQRRFKFPVGTVNNQLLRWNADAVAWEPFGGGDEDGQLLVSKSGGWVRLEAPPLTGTHVLGAVAGVLQWIATEEC